jgi:hypothetical protein
LEDIESYHAFLESSANRIKSTFAELDQARSFIDQKTAEYERETGKVLPRILEPREVLSSSGHEVPNISPEESKKRSLDGVVAAEKTYINTLKNIKNVLQYM